jgi:hypothetical protein
MRLQPEAALLKTSMKRNHYAAFLKLNLQSIINLKSMPNVKTGRAVVFMSAIARASDSGCLPDRSVT